MTQATSKHRRPDADVPIRRPNGTRQSAIIEAAIEVFSEQPYDDVSVADVCERANVAHGLIFYHFGSKKGLFLSAVEEIRRQLIDYQRPRPDETVPVQKVRGFLTRRIEYALAHPHHTRLLRTALSADADLVERLRQARHNADFQIATYLGCPAELSAELRPALYGWLGYVDAVAVECEQNPDADVNYLTDLCLQSLICTVQASSGYRFDQGMEAAALELVVDTKTASTTPRDAAEAKEGGPDGRRKGGRPNAKRRARQTHRRAGSDDGTSSRAHVRSR